MRQFHLLMLLVLSGYAFGGINCENKTDFGSLYEENNPIYSLTLHQSSKGAFCKAISSVKVTYQVQVLKCSSQSSTTTIDWWSKERAVVIDGDPEVCLIHCRAVGYVNKFQFERSTLAIFTYRKKLVNSIVNIQDSLVYRGVSICLNDILQCNQIAYLTCKSFGYKNYVSSFITKFGRYSPTVKGLKCDNILNSIDECKFYNIEIFNSLYTLCHKIYIFCNEIPPSNLDMSFEKYITHPFLSVSPNKQPEENDKITLNCWTTFPVSQRRILRLMRVTSNGSVINNLEWTSEGGGIECTKFNEHVTVQARYSYNATKEDKQDKFICVVEDLLSGISSKREITLTYKVAFSSLTIVGDNQEILTNDTSDGVRNVTSVNITSLECEADSEDPMPQYYWKYTTKNGNSYSEPISSKTFFLTNNLIEKRMPICCIATQQLKAKILKIEKCINLKGYNPEPNNVTMCNDVESKQVACPASTNLLITEVYMASFNSCLDERINLCNSTFISDFFRSERCENNNRCINLMSVFQKKYIFKMMKEELPSFCLEGKTPVLKFVYYCLPKP